MAERLGCRLFVDRLDLPRTLEGFWVSGVSHYQGYLRAAQRGRADLHLCPDPENEYDPDAIAVLHEGHHVGFLSTHLAERYGPLFEPFDKRGVALWATGLIEQSPDTPLIGVRLLLPWPDQLEDWIAAPPELRSAIRFDRARVMLKRPKDFADNLEAVLSGRNSLTTVATMTAEATSKGKYAGQTMLRFHVGGREIGVIQAQYRDQAVPLFEKASSSPVDVQVGITRYEQDIRAHAHFDI